MFSRTLLEKAFTEKRTFLRKSLGKKSFSLKKKTSEKKEAFGKKGQAEMTETLLVLLVIVFLIIIGMFFYYSFFYRSLGFLSREKIDTENLILLHTFSSLPEARCEDEDCVDFVKLIAFKEIAKEKKAYYLSKFGSRRIVVEQVYPRLINLSKSIECSKDKFQQANFPDNCGYVVVYDNLNGKKIEYSISLPVSLYFSSISEYRVGLVRIEGFEG